MRHSITSDPAICHGKPCIRGLRYPVESVLEWFAAGMTIEEVLADYPDLEREDILAALAYAARLAIRREGADHGIDVDDALEMASLTEDY